MRHTLTLWVQIQNLIEGGSRSVTSGYRLLICHLYSFLSKVYRKGVYEKKQTKKKPRKSLLISAVVDKMRE